MAKFLALDGTNGTYASTPHNEALGVTGDITVAARVRPDDWNNPSTQAFASKWGAGDVSWMLRHTPGLSDIRLYWSTDGSAPSSSASTAQVGDVLDVSEAVWVAASLDVDNGAGGHTLRFYASGDGALWHQIGVDVVRSGVTAVHGGSGDVHVGSYTPNAQTLPGAVYRAQIYRGAGFDLNSGPTGTLVADFNAEDAPDDAVGGDSFVSKLTGETWALHGNASIGGVRTVISDDIVLEPNLPRPSVCLTGMARREVRIQAVWRQCR